MGKIRRQILRALSAINKASMSPLCEIEITPQRIVSPFVTVSGMTIKKKSTKKNTHFSCFNTKENGIFERRTKIIDTENPATAAAI
jgi:hypothetical protein